MITTAMMIVTIVTRIMVVVIMRIIAVVLITMRGGRRTKDSCNNENDWNNTPSTYFNMRQLNIQAYIFGLCRVC